ncbi:hypothetical protein [Bradyrhizobium sp.]|uniref:hypothetical protein n=1 Tax=Bradyrhizobium sp. TaxID=376 RepID=UPI002604C260|nr:hypothetical protein [Bradyrhizobium sp.]
MRKANPTIHPCRANDKFISSTRRTFAEASQGPHLHCLRGTFLTWAQEETDFEEEIVEHCMHHITGDAAEKAYKHSKALRKRCQVLQAWADFATKPPAKIVSLDRAA